MPDTIRQLAALQALFPDNTEELISPQDLRDFLVSAMPTGRGATKVLAANNAGDKSKADADRACDGVDDDVQILELTAPDTDLMLTEGTFHIRAEQLQAANNFRLRGRGMGVTRVRLQDGANGRMMFEDSALSYVTIEDLTFDANGVNQSDHASDRDQRCAFMLANIDHLLMRNVGVISPRHGVGIRLSTCSYAHLDHPRLISCGIPGSAFLCDGIYAGDCDHLRIASPFVISARDTGIALEGVVDGVCSGYDIYGAEAAGIAISGSGSRDAQDISIGVGTIRGGVAGTPEGIAVAQFGGGHTSHDISILGPTIDLPAGVWGTERSAIYMEGAGNNNSIRGCTVRSAQYGINWVAGHSHTSETIEDNDFTGATTPETGTRGTSNMVTLARRYGAASISDGGTITHNLGLSPARAFLQPFAAAGSEVFATITAISSTTMTVALKKHDGSAAGATTVAYLVEA